MIANAIFLEIFWNLKVTQPCMCFRVNQVYMLLSQSNIFISSLRWIFISSPVGFVVSPVGILISPAENLLLGLTPEKFLKFGIFHGESSIPYRGTKTGCITILMRSVFYVNSFTPSITITKYTIFMHTQCACSTNNQIYMALFPSLSTNRGSQFLFININFCFLTFFFCFSFCFRFNFGGFFSVWLDFC